MTTILTGDCREMLATLPAESVQCVVTSPLGRSRPRVHGLGQRVDRFHPRRHFRCARRSSHMASAASDTGNLALFLHLAKSEAVDGLLTLNQQEGEQRAKACDSAAVCGVPRPQVSACRLSLKPQTAAELLFEHARDVRCHLLEHDAFAEQRSACVASHTHRVGGSLHADTAVAVYRPGQVGINKVIAHGR